MLMPKYHFLQVNFDEDSASSCELIKSEIVRMTGGTSNLEFEKSSSKL